MTTANEYRPTPEELRQRALDHLEKIKAPLISHRWRDEDILIQVEETLRKFPPPKEEEKEDRKQVLAVMLLSEEVLAKLMAREIMAKDPNKPQKRTFKQTCTLL